MGFSDGQLAHLWDSDELSVRAVREAAGVIPTYKTVDTCAAEFAAETPYHYSTYEDENEVRASDRPRVVILGSGPNRIGQGIEFDYCCVHASFALREAGYETVMINCNPETVSTDYDTSDRLYFEPLTREDVLNVIAAETLASGGTASEGDRVARRPDAAEAVRRAATGADRRHVAELDRPRRGSREVERAVPSSCAFRNLPAAPRSISSRRSRIVDQIGFPVLVRPSYVLGGRAMQIVHDCDHLARAMAELAGFGSLGSRRRPVGRAAGADRPLPRGRDRGRRRRHPRPHRRGADRRSDGARRGGRRAQRRLGMCDPAADPAAVGRRGHRVVHHVDRQGPRCSRADQRPVRGAGHDGLRDRGEPTGQSHRAVRRQGHGRAVGEGGQPGDARRDARRAPRRGTAEACRRRTVTCRSRRPCCRSTASPRSTLRSVRRCARPAR